MNKIRKRMDTTVAFTQEYSSVLYLQGKMSTLSMGSDSPRTHTLVQEDRRERTFYIQNLYVKEEITSLLYFELKVSTDLYKSVAPICALSNIQSQRITRARIGLSPPAGYLYKSWNYQTTEWYSPAQTPHLRLSLLPLEAYKVILFYPEPTLESNATRQHTHQLI